MKTQVLILSFLGLLAHVTQAATTINPINKYAYGANIGWIDWRGDTNNGAVTGEYVCSGYIYSANVGWIHLGDGTPVNGIHYQNNSASDFGVNVDGFGNLRGYAYGANIGWINFESNGVPQVDLFSGRFYGQAYSANCGWISLSNAFAYVKTDLIPKGADSDGDGLTDAWELGYTNSLAGLNGPGDVDGDGASNLAEYLADTNPLDPNDLLRITSIVRGTPTPTYTTVLWTSKITRLYALQDRPLLNSVTPWTDYFVSSFPGLSGLGFDAFTDQRYFRVRAFRPLTP